MNIFNNIIDMIIIVVDWIFFNLLLFILYDYMYLYNKCRFDIYFFIVYKM